MILTLESLPMYCTDDAGCLRWSLGVNNKGYPQARVVPGGCACLVGRYIFTELLGNKLKPGHVVSTTCNDKMCVSPEHLTQKSAGKVLSDAYKRGSRSGPMERHRQLERFQERGSVRLNWDKVDHIRANAHEGREALAKAHGVAVGTIYRVIAGKSWVRPATSAFTWRPQA